MLNLISNHDTQQNLTPFPPIYIKVLKYSVDPLILSMNNQVGIRGKGCRWIERKGYFLGV